MSSNKKGFTLVELAIVLVIVGLLIGGILVAQSMIVTTRVQSFARQIAQYDAAVALFKSKYGAIPGDYSGNAMGSLYAGDGDGVIEPDMPTMIILYEDGNFWTMLSNSGLKREGSTSVYTSGNMNLDVGVPRSKISKTSGVFVLGEAAIDMLDLTAPANVYIIADCGTSSFPMSCSSGITGNDAIAVDLKMDDGAGDTGNVVGTDYNAAANWAAIVDATETTYTAGTDTGAYGLVIRMGSTTGELY